MHLKWCDHHWNQNPSFIPPGLEMRWFHLNEPPIIGVTDFDMTRAITDGRLEKITCEHARYMRETDREIWAL
jgi:hypothetical protein